MANYYRINSDQIDETCLAFIVSGFFWLNSWILLIDCQVQCLHLKDKI